MVKIMSDTVEIMGNIYRREDIQLVSQETIDMFLSRSIGIMDLCNKSGDRDLSQKYKDLIDFVKNARS